MELKASHDEVQTPSSRQCAGSSRTARARDAKSNPRSRRVNRSTRANDFSDFSAEVLRDLNPRGPLESVMADHVVASAWGLKAAIGRQATRQTDGMENPDRPSGGPKRVVPSAVDRAARAVRDALELLDCVRTSREKYETLSQPEPTFYASSLDEIQPNEWPFEPSHAFDDGPIDQAVEVEDDTPIWSDRLVFDFEVSDISPVVKGTWITVGHVVSLIVDGQSWADILRSHPELTEEDVRICVAYAVAQDQDEH